MNFKELLGALRISAQIKTFYGYINDKKTF